jgi:Uma2 family endonuclease
MGVAVIVKRNIVPFTYRDYASWPADERWELIDGVAWDMCAAPSFNHQAISAVLFGTFFTHFRGKQCKVLSAPLDVILPDKDEDDWQNSTTVVQPDILVICDKTKINRKGCVGAPDLVVEIISPYTSKKDIKEKYDLYERTGVKEYWIVFPGEQAIQVYAKTKDSLFDEGRVFDLSGERPEEAVVSSVLFPDLSVRLAELFAD